MENLRWILDGLPMGVWVARAPDGVVEYVNRAFQTIVGISAVEGSRIDDAPATYGLFDRNGIAYPVDQLPFSRVLSTRGPVETDDLVICRSSGEKVNVRAFGVPVYGAGGDITSVIIAFIDNTKQVEAERQRDTMEARLGFIINHAPLAIWAADRHGVVTLSEGAGLASMGVKSGQLVGQNLFDLYAQHPNIPAYLRRALTGESFRYTVEVPGAIYDSFVTPIRDSAGQIVGMAGLSNDVTEIRRLQASAIQNDRIIALGTLAASVAHEINNPLTYVLGYLRTASLELETAAQWMKSTAEAGAAAERPPLERVLSHLELVRGGAERIARIIQDLRSFTRPPAQKLEWVDVQAVVRSVLRLVGKDAEAHARLAVDLEETGPVSADESRLVQVVLNLMVNAIQAVRGGRPEEMEIAVRTRREGTGAAIEVADSGPGVPLADRASIFEPFFSTKALGEGTGLGLFVSRNIIREFGGEITVGDRPEGGALFRVVLPGLHGSRSSEPEPPAAPQNTEVGRKARILVIDDDELVGRALSNSLAGAGHDVTTVSDGEEALDLLLPDGKFDLVFCDLMMQGMSGVDLARVLEERAPDKLHNVVFMTGGAFTPQARDYLQDHPRTTVSKPFDVVAETARRLRALRQS
jgi:PAS domain S-box-containing protein